MFVTLRVNPGQEVPTGYDVICHGTMKDMDAELRYFLNPSARDTANKILADAHTALDRLNGAWDLIAADREAITADRSALRDAAARCALSIDAYEQRIISKQRADAEAEARKIQEDRIRQALDALPDEPDPLEAHHPSGDLHSVDPSEPQHEQQLIEDQGDLPAELTEKVPTDPGDYSLEDPEVLDHPDRNRNQVPQPISISLNSADARRKANGHG
jgi:hypothetical protein